MKPVLNEQRNSLSEVAALEEQYQLATYKKMPIVAERGEGVWIYTSDGERIWIFMAVTRSPAPAIRIRTWSQQFKRKPRSCCSIRTWFTPKLARAPPRNWFQSRPNELTKAFFCNSGTEANENAMRMARMATGRENIITFSGGFHGRTADAISATFLGQVSRDWQTKRAGTSRS